MSWFLIGLFITVWALAALIAASFYRLNMIKVATISLAVVYVVFTSSISKHVNPYITSVAATVLICAMFAPQPPRKDRWLPNRDPAKNPCPPINPPRWTEPTKIGPMTLKNRIMKAAIHEGLATRDGLPTEKLVAHHERFAKNGVALTTVAFGAVSQDGRGYANQTLITQEALPILKRLVDSVHAHGCKASVQLAHCGLQADKSLCQTRPVGPSVTFNAQTLTFVRAATRMDLERITNDFARAAAVAAEAGFDAVEVHMAHGYLLSQFLSPLTNRRKDDFGGTLENRARFPLQVLHAIRQRVGPRVAVLVKVNMADGQERGFTIRQAMRLCALIEATGDADAIIPSGGGYLPTSSFYLMRGGVPLVPLVRQKAMALLGRLGLLFGAGVLNPGWTFSPNFFLGGLCSLRDSGLRIPLIYVGGVTSTADIEAACHEGCPAVQVGRALLAEPGMVSTGMAKGPWVSRCVRCNQCLVKAMGHSSSSPIGSVMNVRAEGLLGRFERGLFSIFYVLLFNSPMPRIKAALFAISSLQLFFLLCAIPTIFYETQWVSIPLGILDFSFTAHSQLAMYLTFGLCAGFFVIIFVGALLVGVFFQKDTAIELPLKILRAALLLLSWVLFIPVLILCSARFPPMSPCPRGCRPICRLGAVHPCAHPPLLHPCSRGGCRPVYAGWVLFIPVLGAILDILDCTYAGAPDGGGPVHSLFPGVACWGLPHAVPSAIAILVAALFLLAMAGAALFVVPRAGFDKRGRGRFELVVLVCKGLLVASVRLLTVWHVLRAVVGLTCTALLVLLLLVNMPYRLRLANVMVPPRPPPGCGCGVVMTEFSFRPPVPGSLHDGLHFMPCLAADTPTTHPAPGTRHPSYGCLYWVSFLAALESAIVHLALPADWAGHWAPFVVLLAAAALTTPALGWLTSSLPVAAWYITSGGYHLLDLEDITPWLGGYHPLAWRISPLGLEDITFLTWRISPSLAWRISPSLGGYHLYGVYHPWSLSPHVPLTQPPPLSLWLDVCTRGIYAVRRYTRALAVRPSDLAQLLAASTPSASPGATPLRSLSPHASWAGSLSRPVPAYPPGNSGGGSPGGSADVTEAGAGGVGMTRGGSGCGPGLMGGLAEGLAHSSSQAAPLVAPSSLLYLQLTGIRSPEEAVARCRWAPRVEWATRFLCWREAASDARLVSFAEAIYAKGLRRFPESHGLHLNYAEFLLTHQRNSVAAGLAIQRAAALDGAAMDTRFAIYACERDSENQASLMDGRARSHVMSMLTLRRSLHQAQRAHKRAKAHVLRVWTFLLRPDYDLHELPGLLDSAVECANGALEAYSSLQQMFPTSVPLLRGYGSLLQDLYGDTELTESFFAQADELEEEKAGGDTTDTGSAHSTAPLRSHSPSPGVPLAGPAALAACATAAPGGAAGTGANKVTRTTEKSASSVAASVGRQSVRSYLINRNSRLIAEDGEDGDGEALDADGAEEGAGSSGGRQARSQIRRVGALLFLLHAVVVAILVVAMAVQSMAFAGTRDTTLVLYGTTNNSDCAQWIVYNTRKLFQLILDYSDPPLAELTDPDDTAAFNVTIPEDHLVDRPHGMREARGSIPLSSISLFPPIIGNCELTADFEMYVEQLAIWGEDLLATTSATGARGEWTASWLARILPLYYPSLIYEKVPGRMAHTSLEECATLFDEPCAAQEPFHTYIKLGEYSGRSLA
ncbi:putative NADH:flavin oxidoreductase [Paratrimastix pyriformis]|uniref:NADH:flavin oxidoreductase n=1 Tax=Paratrimastix pyriformis TaxID=342808 RepID=A0ABQ8UNS5_9EUKA|nr:putative NADH:flavin oxidoreductase [Paratrimastix pyriformis]